MRRVLAMACFVACMFGAGVLPSVDQIAEQNRKALGGTAALEKASALMLTGDCESTAEGESGPVQIAINSPRVVLDLNHGALRTGFSGEAGWRHAAGEALQQRPGRQYVEIVTVFDPARVRWWKEWYPEMAVAGIEEMNGRDTYVLQMSPKNQPSEKLFVDRETGLAVRDEVMPGVVFTFDDYRDVDGLKMAFRIQQTTPAGVTYVYKIKDARIMPSIDSAQFQPK